MSSRFTLEPASPGDDETLREILRETALPSWISFSYQCEPSLSAALEAVGGRHQLVVAKDNDSGVIVGFFSRHVRSVFVNGDCLELGYLGQLRFVSRFRNPVPLMREGYVHWRDRLGTKGALPFDLSVILSDNRPARRLLEAGIKGLPIYSPIGDYSSFAIGTRRLSGSASDPAIRPAEPHELDAVLNFIRQSNKEKLFAPALSDAEISKIQTSGGLEAKDFLVMREGGEIIGALAIWDQRGFKQSVIRSYAPFIRWTRPLINTFLPVTGYPSLPPVNTALKHAFLAFMASRAEGQEAIVKKLVNAARTVASARGLDVLTLGFAKQSAEAAIIKRNFRCLDNTSTIYLVYWADDEIDVDIYRNRPIHQELALL